MTDVPVVWLGSADSVTGATSSIETWAKARGIRLVGFSSDTRVALAYPDEAVNRIEQELTRARDATAALDAVAADSALARAETEVLAHPEAPQSAWLMAEVLRARAARARQVAPKDEGRAEAAIREARSLDGGRAFGIGEGNGPSESDSPANTVLLALEGDEHGDLVVDGRPRRGAKGSVRVTPGRHHVVLAVAGRPVWAAWTSAAVGTRLAVPSLRVPCSRDDFSGVDLRGSDVAAPRVRCDDWVAVRRSPAALFVARCSGERCGPLVEWRVRLPEAPLVPRYEDRRVPAWATWSAIGAAAVVVVSVALVSAGAFETPPETTRFSFGGIVRR